MAYLGRIDEFDVKESWESYMERVAQFFAANSVSEDKKKVAILLSSIGAEAYQELKDMAAPIKPSERTFLADCWLSFENEDDSSVLVNARVGSKSKVGCA